MLEINKQAEGVEIQRRKNYNVIKRKWRSNEQNNRNGSD